ncbi:hypothetical protein BC830DRAFT_71577 [Chytriomyces sp. MP71]|nr:hypothetical protein BC830DRAFT_71577 [Chytriomyces sp. MP71]
MNNSTLLVPKKYLTGQFIKCAFNTIVLFVYFEGLTNKTNHILISERDCQVIGCLNSLLIMFVNFNYNIVFVINVDNAASNTFGVVHYIFILCKKLLPMNQVI